MREKYVLMQTRSNYSNMSPWRRPVGKKFGLEREKKRKCVWRGRILTGEAIGLEEKVKDHLLSVAQEATDRRLIHTCQHPIGNIW